MPEKLPNFSRADEAMRAAEGFFMQVGEICLRHAQAAPALVDRMFLTHTARRSQRLADALSDQREAPDSAPHNAFVQYAPSEPVPGQHDLEQLRRDGGSAPAALDHLVHSSKGWSNIFEHFRRAADTETEQELHAACARLIDTYRRDLATAFQQREQL